MPASAFWALVTRSGSGAGVEFEAGGISCSEDSCASSWIDILKELGGLCGAAPISDSGETSALWALVTGCGLGAGVESEAAWLWVKSSCLAAGPPIQLRKRARARMMANRCGDGRNACGGRSLDTKLGKKEGSI